MKGKERWGGGVFGMRYKKLFPTEFQITRILSGSTVCSNGLQSSVTVFRRSECTEVRTVLRVIYIPTAVRIAVWLEELHVMTNYFFANKYERIYFFVLSARYLVFAKFGFSRQMLIKFHWGRDYACGRADMTKLLGAFRNFRKAPSN